MAEPIRIVKTQDVDGAWEFAVEVGQSDLKVGFKVSLGKEYWRNLTKETCSPEHLVLHSFQFLLSKEPKIAIMREFALKDICEYFPAYEEEMRRRLRVSE